MVRIANEQCDLPNVVAAHPGNGEVLVPRDGLDGVPVRPRELGVQNVHGGLERPDVIASGAISQPRAEPIVSALSPGLCFASSEKKCT